jgi:hypothetical protein
MIRLPSFVMMRRCWKCNSRGEQFVYEREREKRESKEVADKASLQAKNAHTLLTHSLHKKSKDDDILCREIAKKQKDVNVSENVGTIAASLRSKQMNINNGQFNAHLSLDAGKFLFSIFFHSNLLLTLILIYFYSATTL